MTRSIRKMTKIIPPGKCCTKTVRTSIAHQNRARVRDQLRRIYREEERSCRLSLFLS